VPQGLSEEQLGVEIRLKPTRLSLFKLNRPVKHAAMLKVTEKGFGRSFTFCRSSSVSKSPRIYLDRLYQRPAKAPTILTTCALISKIDSEILKKNVIVRPYRGQQEHKEKDQHDKHGVSEALEARIQYVTL
jgi:hypothetical protein